MRDEDGRTVPALWRIRRAVNAAFARDTQVARTGRASARIDGAGTGTEPDAAFAIAPSDPAVRQGDRSTVTAFARASARCGRCVSPSAGSRSRGALWAACSPSRSRAAHAAGADCTRTGSPPPVPPTSASICAPQPLSDTRGSTTSLTRAREEGAQAPNLTVEARVCRPRNEPALFELTAIAALVVGAWIRGARPHCRLEVRGRVLD